MAKCPWCKTGNRVGPRIVTPEMHVDVVAEWCDNEGCEYWVERPANALDYRTVPRDLVIQPNMDARHDQVCVPRAALSVVVDSCVNPGDGGPFELGELPELDILRQVLGRN